MSSGAAYANAPYGGGDLVDGEPAAGSATGVGSASGDAQLEYTGIRVADVQGQALAGGQPSPVVSLSGTSGGSAVMEQPPATQVSELAVQGIYAPATRLIAADLAGAGTMSGDAIVTWASGDTSGVGTATADPTVERMASGGTSGVGTATGDMERDEAAGHADGTGTATASPEREHVAAASATGVGTATADPGAELGAAGTATGVGTATGNPSLEIYPDRFVYGAATGVGTASATAVLEHVAGGASQGTGTLQQQEGAVFRVRRDGQWVNATPKVWRDGEWQNVRILAGAGTAS